MSAAVVVQEMKQELQLEIPRVDLGVKILSVDSRIENISLINSVSKAKGAFEFEVEMEESGRTGDAVEVSYSFVFGKRASGQRCSVRGSATVKFSQFNPTTDFSTLGDDITNAMVVEIFRKNYEGVYLLHQALGLEAPSPWITQEVSMSSRGQEIVA